MQGHTRGRYRYRAFGLVLLLAALLGGCASPPSRPARDGPDANPPAGLVNVPDAEPRLEAIRSGGPNKPYVIFGRRYVPMTQDQPFVERGLASWYGRKFQGLPTSSGEPYDMYAMTAAHPTLPIPSYVWVRNPANGREVLLRVNDRGPFHPGRVIDLSYTAALKLDLLRGVAPVELERITYEAIRSGAWRREAGATRYAAASPPASPKMETETAAGAGAPMAGRSSGADALATTVTAMSRTPASDAAAASTTQDATNAIVATVPSAPTAPTAAAAAAAATAANAATAAAESSEIAAPALPATASLSAGPATAMTTMSQATDPRGVPAATAEARDAPGFWVQLGAFRERDGAASFQRRVAGELTWLTPLLAVFDDASLFRLQAGPYPSRERARDAAESIRAALQLVPLIVERR